MIIDTVARLAVRLSAIILTTMVLLAVGSAARAATVTLVTPPPPATSAPFSKPAVLENPVFRLTGMIETGDAERLKAELDKVKKPANPSLPLATLELSSLGGSLTEGILIGELLRNLGVMALVRERDICLSACALALIGGNAHRKSPAYPADCNVEKGGRVAFHNFFLNRNGLRDVTTADPVASRLQGFADARGGAAVMIKYASDMGLPPSFVANLLGRRVEDFMYIETVGQFLMLRICPTGLTRPELPVEAQAINVCSHSLGSPMPPSAFLATRIPVQQAKQFLLERVQESMQSAKAKGRLADLLSSWSVMRVKDEIDKLYEDLRGAGLILPEIEGPTFEVAINASGSYRTACYVSISTTSPDSFDIVLQGSRGLSEALRGPPDNARRMFLYASDEVVNPNRARPSDGPLELKTPDNVANPSQSDNARPLRPEAKDGKLPRQR